MTFPSFNVSQSWALLKQKKYPLRLPKMWKWYKRTGSRASKFFRDKLLLGLTKAGHFKSHPNHAEQLRWQVLEFSWENRTGRSSWVIKSTPLLTGYLCCFLQKQAPSCRLLGSPARQYHLLFHRHLLVIYPPLFWDELCPVS